MRYVLIAAMALTLVATATNAAAAATPSEYEVDDAIRLRQDFGLQSDRAFVRDTFSDAAKYSDSSWGVPLSKSEAAELNDRVRRVRAAWPAVEVVAERDGFAGVYYDQLRGGVPVFQFSKDRDAAARQVRQIIGGVTSVEVNEVPRSMKRLDEIRQAVFDARDQLTRDSVRLVSVGFDIERNVVEVGVLDNVDRAESLLKEYGPAVRVVRQDTPVFDDACNGADDCRPAKGGIKLSGSKSFCTSGFVGKRTDGNPHLVLLTTGHCWAFAQNSGDTDWWHAGGSQVGARNGSGTQSCRSHTRSCRRTRASSTSRRPSSLT